MIKAPVRFAALLAGLLLVPFATVAAQGFPSDSEVEALIQARVEEGRATGIVVGLHEAGRPARVLTAGESGEGARPLGERSVFEIASITKVFTTTLLMEMAERGEVSLSDPVSLYLPDGVRVPSCTSREVTLLDLATHHSGLPSVPGNLEPADRTNPYADYTVEQLYAFLAGFELERDIGAEFEYSNAGMGLLGHALSLAVGKSYEDLVRERILDPLGMGNTGIELEGEMLEWMAKPHDREGAVVPAWDLPTLAGAGALRSDIQDMLRFLAANIEEADTHLTRAMRTTHESRGDLVPGRMSFGLAWFVRAVGESRIVWHGGATHGSRSFIGFDPDRNVGVVILSNSPHDKDDIGFHLINPESPLDEGPGERVEIAAEILAEYVGEYKVGPGFSIVVTLEDGTLFVQATRQPRVPIFPESETEFFIEVVDAEVTFQRDEVGVVTGLIFHQAGVDLPAPKVR